jgi:hypothetical protein
MALETLLEPITPENWVRFAAFIGQWAIGQRTAYPHPIFASVCQNRMRKSADLQHTQAGWAFGMDRHYA